MSASVDNSLGFFAVPEPDDKAKNPHRQLIGYSGLILPIALWLLAGWRTTEGLPSWKPLSSISAYYYTGAIAAFTGILVALALFLFSYRGYKNSYSLYDRTAAIIAGVAAILVAFFPTEAPYDLEALAWWTPLIGRIHICAAGVLFAAFIFFSLYLFRKSSVKKGESLPRRKKIHNAIYIFCGVAMAVCIVWVGIATINHAPIFWPETLALEFFAVSWLTKGRADITAVRSLHYVRHPRQLLAELRSRTTK